MPLTDDELDAFELEPVPRKRLWALGGCLLLLIGYLFVPVPGIPSGDGSILALIAKKPSPRGQASAFLIFLLAPAVANLLGASLCSTLVRAPLITVSGRGTDILSAVLCVPPLLWACVVTFLVATQGLPESGVEGVLLVVWMYACSGVPLTALVLARSGPGRGVVAAISSASLTLGLLILIVFANRQASAWGLFHALVLLGALTVALGFWTLAPYRRQRKKERAFREAMRERGLGA
jgi:hypothetical protein